MSDEQTTARRRRRTAGARGKLRRGNNVESVVVEETFSLSLPGNTPATLRSELVGNQNTNVAGEGCYVSATVHNNRYYGVLVEQSALKAASLLHFQDEANSLDLNRRMKMLQDANQVVNGKGGEEKGSDTVGTEDAPDSVLQENGSDAVGTEGAPDSDAAQVNGEEHDGSADIATAEAASLDVVPDGDRKRPAETTSQEDEPSLKRVKQEESATTTTAKETPTDLLAVQKFRYVDGNTANIPGYRILVATYANAEAASEDDTNKTQRIEDVCQAGGGFIDKYYYQYEVVSNALETSKINKPTDIGMRTSLGFEKFLNYTGLPTWFPLRNLQTGQHKVLSMLKMKKGKGDTVVFDGDAETSELVGTGTHIPMEPRSRYRVGILGAGIAGLACAKELLDQAERDNVDLEVVLLEGRSRVGGRLLTDETTFKGADGETPFPVDLGASWIHGIEHNPLAALAREAGSNFVTSSEEVKMLTENMGNVDSVVDERIGDLFDDLLDQAAEDCWDQEDFVPKEQRSQKAVRWYASVLGRGSTPGSVSASSETNAPSHRSSSDVSIDHAIGKVIAKNNQKKFAKMSEIEKNLLMWNMYNINYALGANFSDLSMKFWDVDDRHAFEGDHVLLKEGYSQVVRHMLAALEPKGDRFRLELNFPIDKVEYARKSTTLPYAGNGKRGRKMVDLSDACCVTSRNEDQSFKFDFLVSTLPLGVLKESVESDTLPESSSAVSFQPSLPFTKRDSIVNVGFGLLNKVYLQFPNAFWRLATVLPDGQILFGNASGVNPSHYMFYDIGKSLGSGDNAPAILMTLISGQEAVASEQMSDEALVNQVLQTLRVLFSDARVPEPVASKTTRWGGDEFSRGCYTFLPPGTSDQDFQILQSPINGNGDSLVLEGSETMRLFWAGEHTTSLHPSMAHGAMLSGIRAAREVISTLQFRHLEGQEGIDKLVPLAIFRKRNPGMTLQCNFCSLYGSRAREGSLLAFQRGARQVLSHNNCAENCPEVEVTDGKWKNVIKAVNRGKQLDCTLCGQAGATIGCTHPNCFKSYHFSCGEDTGWRFERDGKVFFCDMHRSRKRELDPSECDQVSLKFFRSRFPSPPLMCQLCGAEGDSEQAGALLIFQQKNQHVLVHEKCARFTTVVETIEENEDGEDTFRNLLSAVSLAKFCKKCNSHGATIACSESACASHFHYVCAVELGWNFDKKGKQFRCDSHCGSNTQGKTRVGIDAPTNGTTAPTIRDARALETAAMIANGEVMSHAVSTSNGGPTQDAFATTSDEPMAGVASVVNGAQAQNCAVLASVDNGAKAPVADGDRAHDSTAFTQVANGAKAQDSAFPAPVANNTKAQDSAEGPAPAANGATAQASTASTQVASGDQAQDSAVPIPVANSTKAPDSAQGPAPVTNGALAPDSAQGPLSATNGTQAPDSTAPAPVVNGAQVSENSVDGPAQTTANGTEDTARSSFFQHNLFFGGSNTVVNGDAKKTGGSNSQPSNAEVNGLALPPKESTAVARNTSDDSSEDDVHSTDKEPEVDEMLVPLCADAGYWRKENVSATVTRPSLSDPWNVSFCLVKGDPWNEVFGEQAVGAHEKTALCIDVGKDRPAELEDHDLVVSMNGVRLGSPGAANLQEILSTLRGATSVDMVLARLVED